MNPGVDELENLKEIAGWSAPLDSRRGSEGIIRGSFKFIYIPILRLCQHFRRTIYCRTRSPTHPSLPYIHSRTHAHTRTCTHAHTAASALARCREQRETRNGNEAVTEPHQTHSSHRLQGFKELPIHISDMRRISQVMFLCVCAFVCVCERECVCVRVWKRDR